MQPFLLLCMQVPVRLVDRPYSIFLFFVMGKRAPPVLNNHDQVGYIPEQGDTQRAIELTVKNPVEPVCAQIVPSGAGGINDLVVVAVTVREPGRNEVPV